MIVYQPNKAFLKDILHLGRSYTMRKILYGVLLIGIFAAIVCLSIMYYGIEDVVQLDRNVFNFLGIVLSILLVFRTNTAYGRWWEGRIQWGALVNHCRNLAIQLNITIPENDRESRRDFAVLIANFCYAFTWHLRDGANVAYLKHLKEADALLYSKSGHMPNTISMQIQAKVEALHRSETITGYDHLNIRVHTQALLDILGACERIKKTPIPFSYAVFMRIFILAYVILLPFSLVHDMGHAAIAITMFVFFAFLGIQLMAEEIEDPFGLDCNDLPTGDISENIAKNVFELLGVAHAHTSTEKSDYDKIF
jgi:ion channel-forming bestrophin family protein